MIDGGSITKNEPQRRGGTDNGESIPEQTMHSLVVSSLCLGVSVVRILHVVSRW